MAKSTVTLCLTLLLLATSALSQSDNSYVLDSNGHPVKRGTEYYIKPAITDSGGRFTIVDPTSKGSYCPLHVGQEATDLPEGLPVNFAPFAGEENDAVKVNRDFTVSFKGARATKCVEWKVGEKERESGRRLIVTVEKDDDGSDGHGEYVKYFRIVETDLKGIYNIRWCPTDLCDVCKFDCGTVGGLRQKNGRILTALDGNVLPVVFERKA